MSGRQQTVQSSPPPHTHSTPPAPPAPPPGCPAPARPGPAVPPQPCRIAHSRIERCSPTTCQTHEPAGLPSPPSASSAAPTRRRASTCASVRSPGPAAARQSHQRHATDDVEPGDGELRLEVARRVVHVLGDRAGAQHDTEGVDGAVVDDRPSLGIGLVDGFEHLVLAGSPAPGDDVRTRFPACAAPSRHFPLSVETRRLVDNACRVHSSRTSASRITTIPCFRHAARRIANSSCSVGAVCGRCRSSDPRTSLRTGHLPRLAA